MTDTKKAAEPCPFCGSKHLKTYSHGGTEEPESYVQCIGCTTTGPFGWTEDEAIAAWNRRAAHPSVQVPSGYSLVPIEPTPEMLRAAMDCQDADPGDSDETFFYHSYKAAIAAAPQGDSK